MIATLSGKGQIVIPAKIRRKLRLGEGAKLNVREKGGEITLRPLSGDPIEDSFGCLAGGPSLVEALLEMRKEELAHEENRARQQCSRGPFRERTRRRNHTRSLS